MADDETCSGTIEEGDPLSSLCQCFAPKGLIFKPDGNSGSVLRYTHHGEPEADKTPTFYNDPKAIANNTKGLKICQWKNKGLLWAGIKSNCADITLEFTMGIGQAYPLELPFGLVGKRIRFRGKYQDGGSTITFPFAGSWTFNQYILVGGIPTAQTPMTLSISDLTVTMHYEDPCIWSATLWSASFSDDQATNDGWNQAPETWDPSGATFNNESVHADGRVGIDWRFYNTLIRAGEVTYGPQISAQFIKAPYQGDENTAYGFTTVYETVNYP